MTTHTTAVERPLSALDAIYTRRSVRHFAPRALEPSLVRSLLDAAVQAPTALHAEPWAFVVIQDAEMLMRYSDIAKAAWTERAGKVSELPETGEPEMRRWFIDALATPEFNIFYDAGTLVVICAKAGGEFAVADCWLAAENLMLAACALGLGSCCIGSALPALRLPAVKHELGIPDDVEPVAPVIVGIPAGEIAPSSRKAPHVLVWK